jgi:exopolysaccharide biosynthesis polyprenyl glycosylphosphotransferase
MLTLVEPPTTSPRVEAAPPPVVLPMDARGRPLEWVLEGRGFTALCLASDTLALVAAIVIAAGGFDELLGGTQTALVMLPPVAIVLLAARGMYSRRITSSALDAVARLAGALAIAAMAVVVVEPHLASGASDSDPVLSAAVALGCVVGGRVALVALQRRARSRGSAGTPALIVGSGRVGTQIARRLLGDPRYGLRPVGFVDDPGMPALGAPEGCALPVLGGCDELGELTRRSGARHVIFAFSGAARDAELRPLVSDCERRGVDVSIVPRMYEAINQRVTYERLGGLPLVGLRPVDPRGWQFGVKHAVDFTGALVGLLLLAPLLAAIALIVRLDSPGPILFRQRRVGRDGQAFDLLKFRSMQVALAPVTFVPAGGRAPGGVEGSDRRTRIGRFLRRTSLDELPQLINVLRGEMSLVGPRPERPEFVERFARDVHRYDDRHRVRSGVTGWAQVHGYRGQTSLADRVEWDNYYIEHWSLGMDLKILLLTFVVPFRPSEG